MKKSKRIIAIIIVILLVLLYLSTLVFALIDHPYSHELLMLSVIATLVVPVLMYGFTLFIKVTNDDPDPTSDLKNHIHPKQGQSDSTTNRDQSDSTTNKDQSDNT